ncbi:MAG: ATP-binding protein [Candidatus Sumerlaeaceae bacterium]|nr:ATP-binding protein [Candidatus Sumerlaeaceae bacterium]
MKRFSIRGRVTSQTAGIVLLVSVLSGVSVCILTSRMLVREFDAVLLTKARALGALLRYEGAGEYEFEYHAESMPEFDSGPDAAFFECSGGDGRQVWKSPSLLGRSLAADRGEPSTAPVLENVLLPDGRPGRAATVWFRPVSDDDLPPESDVESAPLAKVVVAKGRADLDRSVQSVVGTVVAGTSAAALLVLALIPFSVRRGLGSLDRLAGQVRQISPNSLNVRLEDAHAPEELVPVYQQLNHLLSRLEQSLERERLFSANVSHELRTPISESKNALEMAALWPDDREVQQRAVALAVGAVAQMEKIVNAMLVLSRTRQATSAWDDNEFDAKTVLQGILTSMEATAAERRLQVQVVTPPDERCMIATSQPLFESMIRNIVQNAIVYAPLATVVRFSLTCEGSALVFTADNDAPDLDPADTEKMFDAFWRKDESRSGGEHLGLGLSLVRFCCEALGGEVSARLSDDKVLTVRLVVPGILTR